MSNLVSFPVVGIGASAGGLESLTKLFQHLAADTGMAFVVIVHLEPTHRTLLPELLGNVTSIAVNEAQDGLAIEPNHAYVIPPNVLLTLREGKLRLHPRHGNPPMPIDTFFRSLAENQGALSIGVVLSGNGSDGALGLGSIKEAEGTTFCQDPQSAKYEGMPRNVIESGYADRVLAPDGIALALSSLPAAVSALSLPEPTEREELKEIFRVIRKGMGLDLNRYRQATVHRRIARRMSLMRTVTLGSYLPYFRQSSDEQQRLVHDVLIGVTHFFRDPEVFAALQDRIVSYLRRTKSPEPELRVWVPGCATGEEAYSIAMCALEASEPSGRSVQVRIFGSDLNDYAIQRARSGRYLENIASDVSAERLERFFERTGSGYRIKKDLRDRCVFSKHDVTEDPPLHRMDIVSCRNLLIYLNPTQQKRSLTAFHFALEPGGLLLLGKSEGIGSKSNLFTKIDQRNRIFQRRALAIRDRSVLGVKEIRSGTAGASRLRLEELLQEQQAGNEEAVAVNEELQSLNEELESAKEELQAANEELVSLNEELRTRNSELSTARQISDSAINTVREPLLILDADLRIYSANEAAYRCFRTTPAETLNRQLAGWWPDLWQTAPLRDALESMASTGAPIRDVEIHDDSPLLGRRVMILSASRIPSSNRILLAVEDVTEKRKHEGHLRLTQKKQAIAQLAGGVAHDFNNLMMGILGNASLLAEEYEAGAPQRAFTDPIITQAQRASHLTQQLLAYSGQSRLQLARLDLSQSVVESCKLTGSSIPPNVVLSLDLDKSLPAILADPIQMHQVIVNLINNSVEAIGEKPGSLLIRTGQTCVEWDDPALSQGQLEPGTYAFIEVHDNGGGIEEQFQARIFDPFFTTKFTGRGLGLAAVLGIVQNHKGTIRVESVAGRGSTFSVLLPTIAGASTVFPAVRRMGKVKDNQVLLIDGDATTLALARATLERDGLRVLTGFDAAVAIVLLREHFEPISVVVIDLETPGVASIADLKRIRALRDDVPLIVSGDSELSGRSAVLRSIGIQEFLSRPLDPAKLLAAVTKALLVKIPAASA